MESLRTIFLITLRGSWELEMIAGRIGKSGWDGKELEPGTIPATSMYTTHNHSFPRGRESLCEYLVMKSEEFMPSQEYAQLKEEP